MWESSATGPASVSLKARTRGRKVRSRYPDLEGRRKTLFDDFTRQYNEKTSFALTPEEYFDSLSVSERTTFDAVTHALMKTNLSDESGASLGSALDLVTGIDRISGQQYGRQGDEQFRIYVRMREGARETMEKSREFSRSRENTVYHARFSDRFSPGRQDANCSDLDVGRRYQG